MRCRRKPGEILGFFFITALMVFLDQWSKQAALSFLKGKADRILIPGLLELTYVENAGMAFGLMEGAFWLFITISLLAIILILYYYFTLPESRAFHVAGAGMILLMAGTWGNLTDRIRLGYVIDLINFIPFSFPVFNIADCCVVTGTGLLVIWLLFFQS